MSQRTLGCIPTCLLFYLFKALFQSSFNRYSVSKQKYHKMHKLRQFQETPLHPVISAAQCNAVGAFCDVICVHVAVNFDYPDGKLSKNHTFIHKFSLTLPQL